MNALGYNYKCLCCGTSGKYITKHLAVAESFRCPHDGSPVRWQAVVPVLKLISEKEVLTVLHSLNTRKI